MEVASVRFEDIREYEGSQSAAWEELSFILAHDLDDLPAHIRLERRGTPDGGVEFTCPGPRGSAGLWGWQAKYLFKFDAATFDQMRGSFKEALKNHPDMTRYAYVLPANPPDGAVGVSGFKKWLKFKDECEKFAYNEGSEVELVLHVRSEVFKALLDEKHASVVLYFFNARFPTAKVLAAQVAQAVSDLGDRYDPDLHVQTEFPAIVEALCLDDAFLADAVAAVRAASAATMEAAEALSGAPASTAPADDLLAHTSPSVDQIDQTERGQPGSVSVSVVRAVRSAAERLSTALGTHLLDLERRRVVAFDAVSALLEECGPPLAEARQEVRQLTRWAEQVRGTGHGGSAPAGHGASAAKHSVDRLRLKVDDAVGAVEAGRHLLRSQRVSAARLGALLVVGEAGCGKSHAIADLVSTRVDQGAPTVLILGNHLKLNTSLGEELGSMVNIDIGWRDLLAGLQTAAQVRDHGRALIAIDAINEGAGAALWRDRLAGLLTEIDKYPMVSVLLSVRDTYERITITDAAAQMCLRTIHPGLAGHEHEAVTMYASRYGLSVPALPPLVPEFTNPLLLRTMCRATRQQGLTALPMVAMGDDWVFGGLMAAVNAAVSAANVLDRDEDEQVAQRGAKALAELMVKAGRESVPLTEAREVCRSIVNDGGSASRSLLGALEREGILIRQPGLRTNPGSGATPSSSGDRIQFTYQRMSDHLRARVLLDRYPTAADLAAALTDQMERGRWGFSGVLEALAALAPARFGVELADLVADQTWAAHAQYDLGLGLMASLPRRPAETINDRTVELIERFISEGVLEDTDWLEVLITLACVPEHPLNIDFLDQRLRAQTLIERDRTWTVTATALWLADENALARTIDWLWGTRRDLPPQAAKQAALLMAWLLTSTSRRLRDSATKVLIEIVDNRTGLLAKIVSDFAEINDPYVRERLLAVSLGHLTRTPRRRPNHSAEADLLDLCNASVRLASSSRPNIAVTHYTGLLLRQVALRIPGKDLPSYSPLATEWPLRVPKVTDLARRLDGRRHGYLKGSPVGYDFAEYILKRGTCRDFVPPDQERLRRLRKRSATARYRRAVARLAEATKQPSAQIEGLLANQTPRMSLRAIRAMARQPGAAVGSAAVGAADIGVAVGESGKEQGGNDQDDVTDVLAIYQGRSPTPVAQQGNDGDVAIDGLALYRDRPPTPLEELRTLHPELTRTAQSAAHESFTRDPVRLDSDDLERWIVDRVLDLGWLPESRGGPYDRPWPSTSSRSAEDKIERIGKKYSWIAHQELLAVLVEHCLRQRWDGEIVGDPSAWDLGHIFDIDPTVTVRADVPSPESGSGRLLARARRPNPSAWWLEGWDSPMSSPTASDETWLRTDLDVPDPRRLMVRTDPRGEEWVVLESHVEWQVDRPAGMPGRAPHRRDMWVRTQSYVCASESRDALRNWSAGQNWMGLWMPTPPDYGLGYLRNYPDGEPWASWHRQSRTERATRFDGGAEELWSGVDARFTPDTGWEIPVDHAYPGDPIALTTYGRNVSPDTDMSSRSGPQCLLPSPLLVSLLGVCPTPAGSPDALGLGPVELQYRWSDADRVVMFGTDGWGGSAPRALLVNIAALSAALTPAGLTWWNWILGEKISWEHGDPTGERLDVFGAGGLGDGGWELWSFDSRFQDYGTR